MSNDIVTSSTKNSCLLDRELSHARLIPWITKITTRLGWRAFVNFKLNTVRSLKNFSGKKNTVLRCLFLYVMTIIAFSCP